MHLKTWKFVTQKMLQLKAAQSNWMQLTQLVGAHPSMSLDVSTKFYINHDHAKNLLYATLRFPSERLEEVLPARHPVRDWAEQLGSQILFSSQWFFSLVNQAKLKLKLGRAVGQPDTFLLPLSKIYNSWFPVKFCCCFWCLYDPDKFVWNILPFISYEQLGSQI